MEKQLEFIKKMLELGAEVELGFFKQIGKEEAAALAKEFSELTNQEVDDIKMNKRKWFKVKSPQIKFAIFYDSKEEKV